MNLTVDNKDVDGFMNCWVELGQFEGYDSGAFGHLRKDRSLPSASWM